MVASATADARTKHKSARAVASTVTTTDDSFECDTCGTVVPFEEARRSETMGNLDPKKWQTLCCPECGNRLKTVFVGGE